MPADEYIAETIEMLRSNDEQIQTSGAQRARRHLAVSLDPPIDAYIRAGALPLFNEFLKNDKK